ncbi:ABC transporter ATP-binding protein [Companilactobacillus sp. RD055328]|uniref:ABC transporter ATP-binding protein n=1 Tax=Companilactobacillus sp. RD055328 TaxID=2916634 RepID=UPI001FC8B955|nr:ABC transporter ATP-binding protein [Companilactobacillus sp. RD055328]GKQ43200.1 ABC transporter ATP-binding protein [Companilactobacillus sp. RD055328]
MNALELKNITKTYSDGNEQIEVLKDINLTVKPGEFVAIVGPSGAGKSTFLTMAGALLQPTEGSIKLSNQEITSMNNKDLTNIRLEKIGFIFQNSELIPYLTAQDQLNIVSKMNHVADYKKRNQNLLAEVGLNDQLNKYPSQLSGGQKQRVAIARSLVNDPVLILADEPTASLDSKRGRQVVQMLQTISHEQNKSVVMVTHDERVLDLVDKIYQIEDGALSAN